MRKYRYHLERHWGDAKPCLFIILNPSTADERKDDRTIKRCISAFGRFAERIVPAGTGGMHGAFDPPASGQPGADGLESRPTHAKGSRSDEPATTPRHQRYHRCDRPNHHRSHLGGGTKPAYAG